MKESTSANYDVTVPLFIMNGSIEERSQRLLSSEATRKVSFEDDLWCLHEYHSAGLNPDLPTTTSILRERNRIISHEKITVAPDLNTKPKSIPRLSRSGDLKTLLQGASALHTPAVSEGSLSSSIHDEESTHTSQNDSCTEASESITAHTSCTGWGQFVDFVPLETVCGSPRGKRVCPTRRRSSSFCASSRYRRHQNNQVNKMYRRQQNRGRSALSPMYNRNKNAFSTNDIADAFRIQLSLSK